jgi:hypothetical protein
MKHLGYALIGGLLFFGVTLFTLKYTTAGVQVDGLIQAIMLGGILKSIVMVASWIGVIAGGLSSVVLRKSQDRKTYVWIILIFILVFTEVVISTIY